MIIKKIHVPDYKLLKSFNIEFSRQISVFIGINGSGKSSILEFLSLVFSSAYEQILLRKKVVAPNSIRLAYVEYLLRFEDQYDAEIVKAKFKIDYIAVRLNIDLDGKANVSIDFDKNSPKELTSLLSKKYKAERLLPNRLIIYYSGISSHFQIAYKTVEDYTLKQLTQNPATKSQGYVDSIHMPMFLFNPSEYVILFAGLWAFGYNNRIDKKLFEILKITPSESLLKLSIKKKEFDLTDYRDRVREIDREIELDPDGYADNPDARSFLISEYNKERVRNFFGASGRLGAFLRQLQESCGNSDSVFDTYNGSYTFLYNLEQWRYLSEEVLQNPKLVFELLLMLKHNGLLEDLNLNIIKDGETITDSNLSEGEKQVIVITALNEILGISNSLFLFDEPDNYLHPSLQDDLINNIEENNLNNELFQNHYLITTHNASFINNINPEEGELIIMSNGKIHNHHLKWFGRDVNDITQQIMGANRRPEWAENELVKVDQLLEPSNLSKGVNAFEDLKKQLSSEDSDIIRLQTKVDFLKD